MGGCDRKPNVLGEPWPDPAQPCPPGTGVYAHFAARRTEALRQVSAALRLPFIPVIKDRLKKERDTIRAEIEKLVAPEQQT